MIISKIKNIFSKKKREIFIYRVNVANKCDFMYATHSQHRFYFTALAKAVLIYFFFYQINIDKQEYIDNHLYLCGAKWIKKPKVTKGS